jgi:hypothetical protein
MAYADNATFFYFRAWYVKRRKMTLNWQMPFDEKPG